MEFNFSTTPEGYECAFSLPAYYVTRLAQFIEEIDKRHGPDRSIGPVEFFKDETETRITIHTQKQGPYILVEEMYGQLKVESGPLGPGEII